MARFFLIVAVLAVSTAAPLVRYAAPAPALTVAAARVCLAAVALLAAAPRAPAMLIRLPRREIALIVAAGVLLGAHFGVWISSLYFTSTAASVALVATQPVFAALLARTLGDAIGRREVLGIAVAAAGCVALGGGDVGTGGSALIGDALALLGAAAAAGYLVLGRRMRVSLPLTPYLAAVNCIAGATLVAAAVCADVPLRGFDSHVYAALAACAVVPSLVGHTLLNWSVRRIPTHLVSLAILGEPIGASALTWLLFDEVPPAHVAVGGAVILCGIAIGFVGRRPADDDAARPPAVERASAPA